MEKVRDENNKYIAVVDKNGSPLMPCLSSRARKRLKKGSARVFSHNPFTIQILDRTREESFLQEMEVKIDPGSKTTGMALCVKGRKRGWFAVLAIHIEHRSHIIKDRLVKRRQIRSSRRSRKTRYRPARFNNRARKPRTNQGYSIWLPPSVISRIENIVNIVAKLQKYYPLSQIVGELNKFDMQKMLNPQISGIEYQRGNLQGFEVREYLLQKYNYTCVYCKKNAFKSDIRLEIDHVLPVSKGGTNKVSNLVLSCKDCNKNKGNNLIEKYLAKKPKLLAEIIKSLGKNLNLTDAAHTNIMGKELYKVLKNRTNLPVKNFPASHTKFNRVRQNYTKDHWVDSVCVGDSGECVDISNIDKIMIWKACGRGSRQMCHMDKYGFPRTGAKSVKRYKYNGVHFQTGDRVKLVQKSGKYKGVHIGVVSIRSDGRFDIKTKTNQITSNVQNFTKIESFNGYNINYKSLD